MNLAPGIHHDARLLALETQWLATRKNLRIAWEDEAPAPLPTPGLSEIEAQIIRTTAHTPIGLAVKVRLLKAYMTDREVMAPVPEIIESLSRDLGEWG